MATDRATAPIVLAAALLLWPAFYNGYPLVFSDTGTYLSQAINHHAGWDRPIVYSVFLLPLHLTLTTWPVIAVQAVLTTHTLHLVQRVLLPRAPAWWLIPTAMLLAVFTSLPWFVAQLMPDLFTPLLVLVLGLLCLAPDRLTRRERWWLMLFATFLIAVHQSNLPLAVGLLLVIAPLRRRLGAATPLGRDGWLRIAIPPTVAALALVTLNIAAYGRASLSPYGNVFFLARIIYDGPGLRVLQRECPRPDWRLCGYLGELPPFADDFLWHPDGPVIRAGGAKLVSVEASAIIKAALHDEPGGVLRALFTNTVSQFAQFATGDGLQAWPGSVTPWVERDFPAIEVARYAAARQTQGTLAVPAALRWQQIAIAIAGIVGCCALAASSRRGLVRGFAVVVLLSLIGNAAITGGLSGPHDRYQSRIIWLAPFTAALGLAGLSLAAAATPIPRHGRA